MFWKKKEKTLPFFLADNTEFANQYAVGRFTYGIPRVVDFQDRNHGKLVIGSFCSIADNVTILLSGNHRTDWITTYPFNVVMPEFNQIAGHPLSRGDVVIGNDVWIGMDSLILSGVTIGDGAVIGARSVVTKDVEPYGVVAGNPARFVRYRFSKEYIDRLQEIKWWEKDISWIKSHMHELLNNDLEPFFRSTQ